jgi:hypothetical protein
MKITTEEWGYKDWLENIEENGHLLRGVPEEFRTVELCLAAVKSCSVSLRYVPREKRTVEICLAAIEKSGWGLEFTPEEIKSPELCLAALTKSYSLYLKYVPEIFLKKDFCPKEECIDIWTANLSANDAKEAFLTDRELLAKYSVEELLTSRYIYLRELAKKNIG